MSAEVINPIAIASVLQSPPPAIPNGTELEFYQSFAAEHMESQDLVIVKSSPSPVQRTNLVADSIPSKLVSISGNLVSNSGPNIASVNLGAYDLDTILCGVLRVRMRIDLSPASGYYARGSLSLIVPIYGQVELQNIGGSLRDGFDCSLSLPWLASGSVRFFMEGSQVRIKVSLKTRVHDFDDVYFDLIRF